MRALQTAVRKKKVAEARKEKALAALKYGRMKLVARKFKKRARELVKELVLPRSLRSSRPWSLRDTKWSVHESSSTGEMELHNYIEFANVQAVLKRTIQANLKAMFLRNVDMSNASDIREELQEASPLFKLYKVRVVRKAVGGDPPWELRGLNADQAQRVIGKALEGLGRTRKSPGLTYEMVAVSLGRGLGEVEKLRRKAIDEHRYTFYERVDVRRQSGGLGVGGLANRTIAQGRRVKNMVGVGGLEHYRLPKDLGKWMEAKKIGYNPQFNPRIRRKKRYCSRVGGKRKCISLPRPRFVWGYNFGLDAAKAGHVVRWIADKNLLAHVDPRRQWGFVWNEVLELRVNSSGPSTAGESEARKLVANLVRKSLFAKHGYAVYCAFQTASGIGHANVMAVQVLPGDARDSLRLVARIMDPHASSPPSRFTDATRAKLEEILAGALNDLARGKGMRAEGVDVQTCDFGKMMANALRVQYGLEGVCGPSALALLLSTVRELKHAAKAGEGIRSPKFCSRAYSHVRIQDAVFVMQLIYRL